VPLIDYYTSAVSDGAEFFVQEANRWDFIIVRMPAEEY
jgi:hypothetical protein